MAAKPSKPYPMLDPKPEPMLDPKPYLMLDSKPEPMVDPKPEPMVDPKPEPMMAGRASKAQPVADPKLQPDAAHGSNRILVAIDATKHITKHALDWALTNVALAGDYITLLAVIPGGSPGWKLWLSLRAECGQAGRIRRNTCCDENHSVESQISDSFSDMLLQLHKHCDAKKAKITLKIVMASRRGAAAAEAQKLSAAWVILDRHMKKEAKYCMEQLQCNLVVITPNHSPRILRVDLKQALLNGESQVSVESSYMADKSLWNLDHGIEHANVGVDTKFRNIVYPVPEKVAASEDSGSPFNVPSPSSATFEQSSTNVPAEDKHISKCEAVKSSGLQMPKSQDSSPKRSSNWTSSKKSLFSSLQKGGEQGNLSAPSSRPNSFKKRNSDPCLDSVLENSAIALLPSAVIVDKENTKHSVDTQNPMPFDVLCTKSECRSDSEEPSPTTRDVSNLNPTRSKNMSGLWQDSKSEVTDSEDKVSKRSLDRFSSIRQAVSLEINLPSVPPPLCSVCQHEAPIFGRPPVKFSFAELQKATKGFLEENFLAEGAFGPVHKGVLSDGQQIAVKQHRVTASSQGDKEFCAEVEVLNCAQHKNVVLLIGYCIEHGRRLLVYEFVCNGSLDAHLFNKEMPPMEWKSRRKVAIGAARGLRFLHEDCRVGCIVHRDLRPNNILLTHDFEPLVGDFGLARWQPDGELEEETRVIGTFGYLAPEYAQRGQITEKADVYSFGVVLLELITGRKAIDFARPRGQQCLTEWARPLMEDHTAYELIDPRLESRYSEGEARCMLHAASLCVRRDASARPRMSQVLKILEGDLQGGAPYGSLCARPSAGSARPRLRTSCGSKSPASPESEQDSPVNSSYQASGSGRMRFQGATSSRARFWGSRDRGLLLGSDMGAELGRHSIVDDKLRGHSDRLPEAPRSARVRGRDSFSLRLGRDLRTSPPASPWLLIDPDVLPVYSLEPSPLGSAGSSVPSIPEPLRGLRELRLHASSHPFGQSKPVLPSF